MGQAVAALGAAAGEDLTAISGSHPLAEPVLFGALALFGLIGTEHFCIHLLVFTFFPGEVALLLLDGGVCFPPQLTLFCPSIDKQ